MRAPSLILAAAILLIGRVAHADRGALTVEASSGVSIESVRLPPSLGSAAQVGASASVDLAGWYAVTNGLELGVRAFLEPPSSWVHDGASSGQFNGSLTSTSSRFGAVAGARFVHGLIWQFTAGASAGFSQRFFSNLDLYDVSGASPRSFGLQLANFSTTSTVVAPSLGLRWIGDHLSVGIEPRLELLFGPGVAWAVTIPLSLSWSVYL